MQTTDSSSSSSSGRGWRILRGFIIALVAFITLVALFYAEEDLRGRHAWHKYVSDAQAKGIELNPQAFEPAPVPDDQNFAMTPFLAPLLDLNPEPLQKGQSRYRDKEGGERAETFATDLNKALSSSKPRVLYGEGKMTDLQALAAVYPANNPTPMSQKDAAETVLRGMDAYKPVLDELHTAAAKRPYGRYDVHYNDENPTAILLTHLAVLKRIGQVLEIRAAAELTLKRSDAAFQDVQLSMTVAESLQSEPILISQLVRMAVLNLARQNIWEGLATRAWTDEQLQAFQQRLEKVGMLDDGVKAERWEKTAHGTTLFDYLRKNPQGLNSVTDNSFEPFIRLAPSGWLYMEQLEYNRLFDDCFLSQNATGAGVIHPGIIVAGQKKLNDAVSGSQLNAMIHHHVLAALLLPALVKYNQRAANSQTSINETVLACALERYHSANGHYPETLAELSPKFIHDIPRDVIDGGSLHYQRGDDDQFQLYSIGWNETDDGGKAVLNKEGSRILEQGDWPWPAYPR